MDEIDTALEQLEKIDNNRRHLDAVSHDGKKRMRDVVQIVCDEFYCQDNQPTLRNYLKPLDLTFDPEEFIEQKDIELPPEIIAITVYMEFLPEMLGAHAKTEIFNKYIKPHSKITEDEYFMVEEYVYQYY